MAKETSTARFSKEFLMWIAQRKKFGETVEETLKRLLEWKNQNLAEEQL